MSGLCNFPSEALIKFYGGYETLPYNYLIIKTRGKSMIKPIKGVNNRATPQKIIEVHGGQNKAFTIMDCATYRPFSDLPTRIIWENRSKITEGCK